MRPLGVLPNGSALPKAVPIRAGAHSNCTTPHTRGAFRSFKPQVRAGRPYGLKARVIPNSLPRPLPLQLVSKAEELKQRVSQNAGDPARKTAESVVTRVASLELETDKAADRILEATGASEEKAQEPFSWTKQWYPLAFVEYLDPKVQASTKQPWL